MERRGKARGKAAKKEWATWQKGQKPALSIHTVEKKKVESKHSPHRQRAKLLVAGSKTPPRRPQGEPTNHQTWSGARKTKKKTWRERDNAP